MQGDACGTLGGGDDGAGPRRAAVAHLRAHGATWAGPACVRTLHCAAVRLRLKKKERTINWQGMESAMKQEPTPSARDTAAHSDLRYLNIAPDAE